MVMRLISSISFRWSWEPARELPGEVLGVDLAARGPCDPGRPAHGGDPGGRATEVDVALGDVGHQALQLLDVVALEADQQPGAVGRPRAGQKVQLDPPSGRDSFQLLPEDRVL